MSVRSTPGLIAALLGVVLAIGLFVPFVAISYRRRGQVGLARAFVWFALLVYGLSIWAYTLVPFPTPGEIRCVGTQLRPLQFAADIASHETSSVSALLHNSAAQQVALNVLLFVPLGLFARLLFRRGLATTVAIGLGVSLFVEVTQLTGVWTLYPCAFRLFDVDDLLANTTGAALGWAIAVLAPRRRTRRTAPERANSVVGPGRRILGMACDLLTVMLVGFAAAIVVQGWQLYVLGRPIEEVNTAVTEAVGWAVPFLVLASLTLATGRTVGDHAVQILYTGSRFPSALARGSRFLAGIGGFQLLQLLPGPGPILFAALAVGLVFVTPDRRGLPGLLSRQRLESAITTKVHHG